MALTDEQKVALQERIVEIAANMVACGNGSPLDSLAAAALVAATFGEHFPNGRTLFMGYANAAFDRFERLAAERAA